MLKSMGATSEHNDEGVEGSRCPHCGRKVTDLVRKYSSLDEMKMKATIRYWFWNTRNIVWAMDMNELMFGIRNPCILREKIFEDLRSEEGIKVVTIKSCENVIGWVRV